MEKKDKFIWEQKSEEEIEEEIIENLSDNCGEAYDIFMKMLETMESNKYVEEHPERFKRLKRGIDEIIEKIDEMWRE